MKVAIDRIVIGKRIREDRGDVRGMADSLAKYGLIEPIVVTGGDYRLICGERRLLGARGLGWTEIEAEVKWGLDEAQCWQLEREENEQRKALTASESAKGYEASRRIAGKAAETAPRLSSNSEVGQTRPGRRTYEVPKADIAQAMGIGVGSLVRAEQHVAAVEAYPELEDLPQQPAIATAKALTALPEPEREQARERIAEQSPEERRALAREQAKVDAATGARLLSIVGDPEGNIARASLKAQYGKHVAKVLASLLELGPDEIAATLDEGDRQSAQWFIHDTRAWLDRFDAALRQGVHVVGEEEA